MLRLVGLALVGSVLMSGCGVFKNTVAARRQAAGGAFDREVSAFLAIGVPDTPEAMGQYVDGFERIHQRCREVHTRERTVTGAALEARIKDCRTPIHERFYANWMSATFRQSKAADPWHYHWAARTLLNYVGHDWWHGPRAIPQAHLTGGARQRQQEDEARFSVRGSYAEPGSIACVTSTEPLGARRTGVALSYHVKPSDRVWVRCYFDGGKARFIAGKRAVQVDVTVSVTTDSQRLQRRLPISLGGEGDTVDFELPLARLAQGARFGYASLRLDIQYTTHTEDRWDPSRQAMVRVPVRAGHHASTALSFAR